MSELLRRALIATTLGGLTAVEMLVHGARDPQLILAAVGFISGLTGLFWIAPGPSGDDPEPPAGWRQ